MSSVPDQRAADSLLRRRLDALLREAREVQNRYKQITDDVEQIQIQLVRQKRPADLKRKSVTDPDRQV